MGIHLDCHSVNPLKMKKHSLHQIVHPYIKKTLVCAIPRIQHRTSVQRREIHSLRRICLKHQTSRNNNALTYVLLFDCKSCWETPSAPLSAIVLWHFWATFTKWLTCKFANHMNDSQINTSILPYQSTFRKVSNF